MNKKLEQIKEEVREYLGVYSEDKINDYVDEVAKRYAKEVTKDLKMKIRFQDRLTSNKAITETLFGKVCYIPLQGRKSLRGAKTRVKSKI